MLSQVARIIHCCLVIFLLAGCMDAATKERAAAPSSLPPPAPADPNIVSIDNFSYSPQTLTISPGTTITWINHDDVPHTVTSIAKPRTLDSPVLDTDGRFQFTFQTPGEYPYYCTVHPHMTAKIVVK